jgi:hypothetical protein
MCRLLDGFARRSDNRALAAKQAGLNAIQAAMQIAIPNRQGDWPFVWQPARERHSTGTARGTVPANARHPRWNRLRAARTVASSVLFPSKGKRTAADLMFSESLECFQMRATRLSAG